MNRKILLSCERCLIGLALAIAGCATLPAPKYPPAATITIESLAPDQRGRVEREANAVHAQMTALQARFERQERERIAAQNRVTAQHVAAIERNGGFRATVEQEIRALQAQIAANRRAQHTDAAAQLGALQNLIGNIAFCSRPLIFSEESYRSAQIPGATSFAVEPRVTVLIEGCHFGAAAGKLQLLLPATHETLSLNISHWQDDIITGQLPAQNARPDQAAQLIVIAADNTQSPALDVDFRATREWTYLDPVAHPGVLLTDCRHNTTTDVCEAAAHAGPPPTLIVAAAAGHFTFCCSSVAGTDRWFLALRNGWLPSWLVYNSASAPAAPDLPDVYVGFSADGYTTCNFFNRDGRITDYQAMASSDARYQGEVDISWWVDHSCSGINYAANFPIIGPAGVPYW